MVKKIKKLNSNGKKVKSTKKTEKKNKSKNIASKLIIKKRKAKRKTNETNIKESKQTDLKGKKSENKNNDNKIINNYKIVHIKSSDNKLFNTPIDILPKAKLISELIEDAIEDNESILLKEVDSKNFDLIIEYLQHYKDKEPKEIPKPFPERTDEEFLRGILDNDDNDWTYNFISKLNLEEAINLVNAADYLQIQGLINLLAAKIAHEMVNCEVEEARKKFGIECDLTEEEVAEYDKYPLD